MLKVTVIYYYAGMFLLMRCASSEPFRFSGWVVALHAQDHHGRYRHVFVVALSGRGSIPNLVHHIHAFHDLAEDRIAIAHRGFVLVVEKIIVHHIDEKLRGGAVDHIGPSHGDGATVILEFGAGLVFNLVAGWFGFEVRCQASTLDHKIF